MRVFSKKTICTVKAFTDGMMAENSKEHMSIILWRDMEYSHGKMDASTLVATKMIKNVDTVLSSGQMAENILALGRMANNMAKELISTEAAEKEKAPGKLVKELTGSTVHQGTNDFFRKTIIILLKI